MPVHLDPQLQAINLYITQNDQSKGNYIEFLDKFKYLLRESEWHYGSLVANIPDIIFSLNQNGVILSINQAVRAIGYAPESLIGKTFNDLIYFEDRDRVVQSYYEAVARKVNCTRIQRFRVQSMSGEIRWFESHCYIRFSDDQCFFHQDGVCRDVTKSIEQEQSLIRARDELEEKVRTRTIELMTANNELALKIQQQQETEKALRKRESELRCEKENLEEVNTALQVLLKRRETDKQDLREQIMLNIRQLVLPYIDKLKKGVLQEGQMACIHILESNIKEITASFGRQLSLNVYGLTPAEMKIANLIRQGRRTQQIAKLLNVSQRTVENHRQRIRRKLNICNANINLQTFLVSLGQSE